MLQTASFISCCILSIVFIILGINHKIEWSFWWYISPVLIWVGCMALILIYASIVTHRYKKKDKEKPKTQLKFYSRNNRFEHLN